MKTKKEKYIDDMAKQLKEWSRKIDELEAKAVDASADAKAEVENRIRELKTKRDEVTAKMRDLGQASGTAWLTIRKGMDTAWKDLKNAVEAARDKFKKAA